MKALSRVKRDDLPKTDLPAPQLGHEARSSSDDHVALKLWLRLLSCTAQIETELRRRLRSRFRVTLARFDYMAQLYRRPNGLKMGDLTQMLMVTGGSVTGLTDAMEREGLVKRESDPSDRRACIVSMTDEGKRVFRRMAKEHEEWIVELIGALDQRTLRTLHTELGRLRLQLSGLKRTK